MVIPRCPAILTFASIAAILDVNVELMEFFRKLKFIIGYSKCMAAVGHRAQKA